MTTGRSALGYAGSTRVIRYSWRRNRYCCPRLVAQWKWCPI